MSKRKQIAMIVIVSVPHRLTASDARREVRTLINNQSNWLADIDEGDVKAISVKPAPFKPANAETPLLKSEAV